MPLTRPEIEELLERERRYCEGVDDEVCAQLVAVADLPTRYGHFQIVGFYNNQDGKDHVAVIKGNVCDGEGVLVRIHSECLTGDCLGSMRCDCGEQLARTLEMMEKEGAGAVLYMRQEGRGIGLLNKIRAYQLQDFGYDTLEANLALGFEEDERDYEVCAHMLRGLQVRSVRLVTNNPKKVEGLERQGIKVVERLPLLVPPNEHNRTYLTTKMERAGHLLQDVLRDDGE